jgi:hypothetical protein
MRRAGNLKRKSSNQYPYIAQKIFKCVIMLPVAAGLEIAYWRNHPYSFVWQSTEKPNTSQLFSL